jgi:hypothetical protein
MPSADSIERLAKLRASKRESDFKAAAKRQQEAFDRAAYVAKSQSASKKNVAKKGEALSGFVKNAIFDWTSPEMMALSAIPFGIGKIGRLGGEAASAASAAGRAASNISPAEIKALEEFMQSPKTAYSPNMFLDEINAVTGRGVIPSGQQMFRVPTTNELGRLNALKAGDSYTLPKATSVADQNQLEALGKLAQGKFDTGGRVSSQPPNAIMRFLPEEDIAGVQSFNKLSPGITDRVFGYTKSTNKPYPFADEGLLAPGLQATLRSITGSPDMRIYEIALRNAIRNAR